MWQWVLPDEEHRRRALPVSTHASIIWGQILGHGYAIGEPAHGLSIWAPPGMADVDVDPDGTKTGWNEVVAAVGPDGIRKFELMVEVQRPFRDKHIPPNGWYLPWLGVDPVSQRSGAGTALLNDMFARLDPQGITTYLETEKAANVTYYERHGYQVVHEGVLPENGPGFWCMLRTSA
jgi:GNAT superfamily N-acetyltransferase